MSLCGNFCSCPCSAGTDRTCRSCWSRIPHRSFLTTLSYVQFQSIASRGKSSAKLLLKATPRCCNRCFTKQLLSHNSRLTDKLPTFTKLQRSLCRNTDTTECYCSVSATRFLLHRRNRPPCSPDPSTKDLFPLSYLKAKVCGTHPISILDLNQRIRQCYIAVPNNLLQYLMVSLASRLQECKPGGRGHLKHVIVKCWCLQLIIWCVVSV